MHVIDCLSAALILNGWDEKTPMRIVMEMFRNLMAVDQELERLHIS